MASIEARYLSNNYHQIIRILILRFFISISNQIWPDISYKHHGGSYFFSTSVFVNSLRGTNWTTRLSRRKTDGRKKRKEVYVQGGTLSRRKGPGQRKFCEQAEVLKSATISIWATRKSLARVAFFFFFHGYSTLLHFRGQTILLASRINLATIIDDLSW